MPIILKDKMKELSPAQRTKVAGRAAELISEEMTLRELQHAQANAGKDRQDTRQPGQRFAPRKAERSLAVYPPKNGRGHGRESFDYSPTCLATRLTSGSWRTISVLV
jgi:hypothetical protein